MTDIIIFYKYRSDIRLSNPKGNNMENIARVPASAIFILLAPVVLLAHAGGHGHESPLSSRHYFANPEHFLPLALVVGTVLMAVITYRFYRSKMRQSK